eukprot:2281591-Pyramimonas_sp.AAC.1
MGTGANLTNMRSGGGILPESTTNSGSSMQGLGGVGGEMAVSSQISNSGGMAGLQRGANLNIRGEAGPGVNKPNFSPTNSQNSTGSGGAQGAKPNQPMNLRVQFHTRLQYQQFRMLSPQQQQQLLTQ